MPVPDGAFDFGVAEQELNRSQVAGATIDQSRLGSPEWVSTEESWVEPDAGDPFGEDSRVLPGCHALIRTTPPVEQELSGFLRVTFM